MLADHEKCEQALEPRVNVADLLLGEAFLCRVYKQDGSEELWRYEDGTWTREER